MGWGVGDIQGFLGYMQASSFFLLISPSVQISDEPISAQADPLTQKCFFDDIGLLLAESIEDLS